MDKEPSTKSNKALGYLAKRIAVRADNMTCPF